MLPLCMLLNCPGDEMLIIELILINYVLVQVLSFDKKKISSE